MPQVCEATTWTVFSQLEAKVNNCYCSKAPGRQMLGNHGVGEFGGMYDLFLSCFQSIDG